MSDRGCQKMKVAFLSTHSSVSIDTVIVAVAELNDELLERAMMWLRQAARDSVHRHSQAVFGDTADDFLIAALRKTGLETYCR